MTAATYQPAARRIHATGRVTFSPEISDPLGLFTPEGERVWAERWDPRYPDAGSRQPGPGSVFIVSHDDTSTTWVITDHVPGRSIRYVRFRPDMQAGMLSVTITEPGVATVTYDITALSEQGLLESKHLESHVQQMLDGWSRMIEAAMAGPPRVTERPASSE